MADLLDDKRLYHTAPPPSTGIGPLQQKSGGQTRLAATLR